MEAEVTCRDQRWKSHFGVGWVNLSGGGIEGDVV